MAETREDEIRQLVDRVYRAESSRILATLIRLLGDFDLAEDAMQDAFAAALVRWSRDGAPENPRAWLVSAARFEAVDSLRRRARFDASLERIAETTRDTNKRRQSVNLLEYRRLLPLSLHSTPSISSLLQLAQQIRQPRQKCARSDATMRILADAGQ